MSQVIESIFVVNSLLTTKIEGVNRQTQPVEEGVEIRVTGGRTKTTEETKGTVKRVVMQRKQLRAMFGSEVLMNTGTSER
jgi:hypothetical protein